MCVCCVFVVDPDEVRQQAAPHKAQNNVTHTHSQPPPVSHVGHRVRRPSAAPAAQMLYYGSAVVSCVANPPSCETLAKRQLAFVKAPKFTAQVTPANTHLLSRVRGLLFNKSSHFLFCAESMMRSLKTKGDHFHLLTGNRSGWIHHV